MLLSHTLSTFHAIFCIGSPTLDLLECLVCSIKQNNGTLDPSATTEWLLTHSTKVMPCLFLFTLLITCDPMSIIPDMVHKSDSYCTTW